MQRNKMENKFNKQDLIILSNNLEQEVLLLKSKISILQKELEIKEICVDAVKKFALAVEFILKNNDTV